MTLSEKKDIDAIPVSTGISQLNSFELTITEHVKELNFVPDMSTDETRKASKEVLKRAKKTYNAVDKLRLSLKKEAEKEAKKIHEYGKKALGTLDAAFSPHKDALDAFKAEEAAREEARLKLFNDACDWLRDMREEAAEPFTSAERIKQIISEKIPFDIASFNNSEAFEYGKIKMDTDSKIDRLLSLAITREIEEKEREKQAVAIAEEREKLRQEREKLERAQQIQREKEIAEQAAAEAKAKADREAKEKAEQAAIDAENARIAEAKAAEEREKQAAINERMRIEREQEAQRVEAERKAANVEHQRSINALSVNELLESGLSEDQAKSVIKKLVRKQFTHITINY
jgi:colicin import membrane protein